MYYDMHMTHTAAIFDVHDDCDVRLNYVKKVLEDNGYETDIYLPDFDHYAKKYRTSLKPCIHYLHILPYKSNFSYARIRSFSKFAHDCMETAKEKHYDLVYAIIPPNSMVREFSKLKEANPSMTLIYEIKDMWPETFPSRKLSKALALPFSLWRSIRNQTLDKGDILITECNLFQDILKKQTGIDRFHTIYLCNQQIMTEPVVPAKPLNFVYLGSINHVIDIERICSFMKVMNTLEPCHLEIIGDGDSREEFLKLLDENKVDCTFHGLVFEEDKKIEILSHCHYGLNTFKDTACVGLTMKSLDYMAYDLPLINTIHGDTERIVEEENIGFNLNDIEKTAHDIHSCSDTAYLNMKKNVIAVHEKYFSIDVFTRKLEDILPK